MVATPAAQSLDRSLLLAFPRPPALDFSARAITFLGGNTFTLAVTILAAILLFHRMRGLALLPFLAVLAGIVLQNLLKWMFHRPRPDLLPHGVDVSNWSYPSGHAMLSAIAYFSLAALFPCRYRALAHTIAAVLTILIGLTRLYFGVHWPTDVLAGWLIGLACVGLTQFAGTHR